jgi:hypothetical protein
VASASPVRDPAPRAVSSRPAGITVVAGFFVLATAVSAVSLLALAAPGSPLRALWRLHPEAQAHFAAMGPWALFLLAGLMVGCATAARGLWRGSRAGYAVAIVLLGASLAGDLVNAAWGEPGAIWGVPPAAALLGILLTARSRAFVRIAGAPSARER